MPQRREISETRTFEYLEPVGMEWRALRKRRVMMNLSQGIRTKAIQAINQEVSEETKTYIRALGKDDAEWWITAQSKRYPEWLKEVRTALEIDGLNAQTMAVDNLDDYLIGLVEMAVGLTDQSPEPPSGEDIVTGKI
jgi:hypothetical protein